MGDLIDRHHYHRHRHRRLGPLDWWVEDEGSYLLQQLLLVLVLVLVIQLSMKSKLSGHHKHSSNSNSHLINLSSRHLIVETPFLAVVRSDSDR